MGIYWIVQKSFLIEEEQLRALENRMWEQEKLTTFLEADVSYQTCS